MDTSSIHEKCSVVHVIVLDKPGGNCRLNVSLCIYHNIGNGFWIQAILLANFYGLFKEVGERLSRVSRSISYAVMW